MVDSYVKKKRNARGKIWICVIIKEKQSEENEYCVIIKSDFLINFLNN